MVYPFDIFIGAKRAREVLFSVLRDACIAGDLLIPEAVEAAEDILARNAIQFYKINVYDEASDIKNVLPQDIAKKEATNPQRDIVFVRILWVDGSGQHRCRVSLFAFFFPLIYGNV